MIRTVLTCFSDTPVKYKQNFWFCANSSTSCTTEKKPNGLLWAWKVTSPLLFSGAVSPWIGSKTSACWPVFKCYHRERVKASNRSGHETVDSATAAAYWTTADTRWLTRHLFITERRWSWDSWQDPELYLTIMTGKVGTHPGRYPKWALAQEWVNNWLIGRFTRSRRQSMTVPPLTPTSTIMATTVVGGFSMMRHMKDHPRWLSWWDLDWETCKCERSELSPLVTLTPSMHIILPTVLERTDIQANGAAISQAWWGFKVCEEGKGSTSSSHSQCGQCDISWYQINGQYVTTI